jgi:diguanylate cyclase (GGDEF)-like protein/PAS domain S-box-containing protein
MADAFLAHSSDLILLFTGDGTITWASASAEHLFGLPASALVGRNGLEMIHPEDQERAMAAFLEIPGLGDQTRVEMRVIDPHGRCRWVEEIATNLLDEPEVGSVVGHLRDITDRRAAEEAIRFQASLLDAVGEAVVACDLSGTTIYWNSAASALFGWTAAEALGQPLDRLIPTTEPTERVAVARAVSDDGAGLRWEGEVTVTGKDGRPIVVHTTCTPVLDDAGGHVATIAVSTDLSESIVQRRRAEEDHRRLAEAQASAHLGSFELDLATGDLNGSAELWRILGREPSRLARLEHVHPEDRETFRDALRRASRGERDVTCTHRIVRCDGTIRWVVSRSSRYLRADHVLAGTMLDVTERHEAEVALRHQATHDPLTDLPNRTAFVDALDRLLDAGRTDVAVLFIDLDDFKAVNDRMGHVDADGLLREVGRRLDDVTPPGGTACRLGGDEFVVFATGIHDEADLRALLATIQGAIQRPFVGPPGPIRVDASIGMARAEPGQGAESLLRNADMAMYAAKEAGGGRGQLFDLRLNQQDRERRELRGELRTALAEGQVVAHFQPQCELATGRLVGFEALARWPHPERGLVPPDHFIALAEESDLIGELGRQMLETACRALASWDAARPDLALVIGVNVSPNQLADPQFPDLVAATLHATGVEGGRLCLEVTESTLMDVEAAATAVRRLRALGTTVAIDDFGTGYSSFSRIKHVPVDLLKIDRSFVADIGRTTQDDVILSTMAGLARSLRVAVVAEGIETEHQRRVLAELGCEYGQGYLLGRPLPLSGADALVCAQPRA